MMKKSLLLCLLTLATGCSHNSTTYITPQLILDANQVCANFGGLDGLDDVKYYPYTEQYRYNAYCIDGTKLTRTIFRVVR